MGEKTNVDQKWVESFLLARLQTHEKKWPHIFCLFEEKAFLGEKGGNNPQNDGVRQLKYTNKATENNPYS